MCSSSTLLGLAEKTFKIVCPLAFQSTSFFKTFDFKGSVSGKTNSLSKSPSPNQKLFCSTTSVQLTRTATKMPRSEYNNDFRSHYPGRSTVDWMRPSTGARYETVEYAPSDSRGIDPTSFRKNAFSFDTRSGQQPKDYRHYDVQGGSSSRYAERDSGYVHRGRENYGSSDRYGGGGGDKLSRDASRMRSGAGGGYDSYDSSSYRGSDYGSRYESRDDRGYESSSRSRSGFADFLRSSSSARRDRDRSPTRYFSPGDIGRSSSSRSRRPSMGYGSGYEERGRGSSRAHGSSGEYMTETITPGGYGSSSRSSRDRSRYID